MGMPKNLFLVRHGQSEGNLARKAFEATNDESSFTDEFMGLHESQYELTSLGINQAKEAGKWFTGSGFSRFDRMLVSNNVRAMQTAAHLELPQAKWMVDYNLRERENGLFNVIRPSTRDTDYKDQQAFHDSQPFFFRPPQGESVADLCNRVKIVLDTLARECELMDVIIVCHGHTMRAFQIVLERLPLGKSNEFLSTTEEWGRVPNCAILHYTRENPLETMPMITKRFEWVRMIRPAGGGNYQDEFRMIPRKKFSNEELLVEARKNRGVLSLSQ